MSEEYYVAVDLSENDSRVVWLGPFEGKETADIAAEQSGAARGENQNSPVVAAKCMLLRLVGRAILFGPVIHPAIL